MSLPREEYPREDDATERAARLPEGLLKLIPATGAGMTFEKPEEM
jgi:hypothetical protein